MRKVEKQLGMMRALLRQAMILSDETGLDVHCHVRKATNAHDKDGTVFVGDYEIEFTADPQSTEINYEPEGRVKEWIEDLDESRIHSLTEPPREKGPAAGQSTRGPEQK